MTILKGFRTADDRAKEKKPFNCVILAPNGVGKTTLATQLPPEQTLVINIESGLKSIGNSNLTDFDVIQFCSDYNKTERGIQKPLNPWILTQMLICAIAGPTPGEPAESINSAESYQMIKQFFAEVMGIDITTFFDQFKYLFIDSISDLSTLCYNYNAHFYEGRFTKKGELNPMAIYGQVGIELENLISKIQKCPNKSCIMAMKHNLSVDDYSKPIWKPECKGSVGYNALKGIFDCVWALHIFQPDDAQKEQYAPFLCKDGLYRTIITNKRNDYGMEDLKTRGINKDGFPPLSTYEVPNLFSVLQKLEQSEF